MKNFVPAADQMDPSLLEKWGESFGSAKLGMMIGSHPRFKERIQKKIMERSGIDADAKFSDDYGKSA